MMLMKIGYGLVLTAAAATGVVASIHPSTQGELPTDECSQVFALPDNVHPVIVSGTPKGWVMEAGPRLFDAWFSPSTPPSKPAGSKAPVAKAHTHALKANPSKQSKHTAKSSMHQDLDRIFGRPKNRPRTDWQRTRHDYDLFSKKQRKSTYFGSFPGRS